MRHLWAGIALGGLYVSMGAAVVVALFQLPFPEVMAPIGMIAIIVFVAQTSITIQMGSNEMSETTRTTFRGTGRDM